MEGEDEAEETADSAVLLVGAEAVAPVEEEEEVGGVLLPLVAMEAVTEGAATEVAERVSMAIMEGLLVRFDARASL